MEVNFGVASNPGVFHPAEKIHQWLAYALFAVAALHAFAALYHHFVRRDSVLVRMLPGGTGQARPRTAAAIRITE